MWPFKKQKLYSEENVKFIIKEILRNTVDRDNVRDILKSNVITTPKDLIIQVLFEKLNELESKTDTYHEDFWMERLNSIEKFKMF